MYLKRDEDKFNHIEITYGSVVDSSLNRILLRNQTRCRMNEEDLNDISQLKSQGGIISLGSCIVYSKQSIVIDLLEEAFHMKEGFSEKLDWLTMGYSRKNCSPYVEEVHFGKMSIYRFFGPPWIFSLSLQTLPRYFCPFFGSTLDLISPCYPGYHNSSTLEVRTIPGIAQFDIRFH